MKNTKKLWMENLAILVCIMLVVLYSPVFSVSVQADVPYYFEESFNYADDTILNGTNGWIFERANGMTNSVGTIVVKSGRLKFTKPEQTSTSSLAAHLNLSTLLKTTGNSGKFLVQYDVEYETIPQLRDINSLGTSTDGWVPLTLLSSNGKGAWQAKYKEGGVAQQKAFTDPADYFNKTNQTFTISQIYDLDTGEYSLYYDGKNATNPSATGGFLSPVGANGIALLSFTFQNTNYYGGSAPNVNNSGVIYIDNIKLKKVADGATTVTPSVQNGNSNISLKDGITLDFSQEMLASSLNNIAIYEGATATGTPIAGLTRELSVDKKSYTIKAPAYKSYTAYTLSIPKAVVDANYASLSQAQTITFTTGYIENVKYLYEEKFNYADGTILHGTNGWSFERTNGMANSVGTIVVENGRLKFTKPEQTIASSLTSYLNLSTLSKMTDKVGKYLLQYDIEYGAVPQLNDINSLMTFTNSMLELSSIMSQGKGSWQVKYKENGTNVQKAFTNPASYYFDKTNETFTISQIYDFDTNQYSLYYDGIAATNPSSTGGFLNSTGNNGIAGLFFAFQNTNYYSGGSPAADTSRNEVMYIDNIKIKSISEPNILSSSLDDALTTAISTTDDILVEFSTAMNTGTFANIKLYEGNSQTGTEVTGLNYSFTSDERGYSLSLPANGLKNSTRYTLVIPNSVASKDFSKISNTQYSFVTNATPQTFSVQNVAITDWNAVPITVLNANQNVKVSADFVDSGTQLSQHASLIVGLYDASNSLKKVAYVTETITKNQIKPISAQFTTTADTTTGYYIKIFAWDDFENMTSMSTVIRFPQ